MLKVHEKSTYSSRVNAKMSSLRKTVITPDSSDSDIKGLDRASRLYEDTQFVLATTRGRDLFPCPYLHSIHC